MSASSTPLYIGLRYARSSANNHFIGFINRFSVVGIALGLAALIIVSAVMNGFEGQLKARILGVQPHLVVTSGLTDPQRQQLLALPGVLGASPHVQAQALVQSRFGLQGAWLFGIDSSSLQRMPGLTDAIISGNADLPGGEYGVLMGRGLATRLGLRPGDRVRLMLPGTLVYTPLGNLPSQRQFTLTGVFAMNSELDESLAMVHYRDASKLLRKPAGAAVSTRLFLQDPFDYPDIQYWLDTRDLEATNWREFQGPLFDAVKMEKNMMSLMLMLVIAVAAFNIVSSLVMVVSEKQGDLAILATLGLTPGRLMTVFVVAGLFNGIKGVLWGVAIGLLLLSQLNTVLALLGLELLPGAGYQGLPYELVPAQLLGFIALILALSFFSTLYPAWRATKVDPASSLRYE